jgi:hypothetical protein
MSRWGRLLPAGDGDGAGGCAALSDLLSCLPAFLCLRSSTAWLLVMPPSVAPIPCATPPHTHPCVCCRLLCVCGGQQVGKPSEEQLRLWAHHSDTATVPDQVLRRIGGEHVSFVFSLEVEGRAVDPEPPLQLLPKAPANHHQLAAGRQQRRLPGPASHTSQPALAAAASGTSRSAGPLSAAAAASAMLAARRLEAAPAAALPPQQQQQQQQPQAAKENAGTNVVEAPRSRLALPRSKPASGAAAGALAKRAVARHPAGLAAAAQRAVCTILDSDDDSV